MYQTEQEVVSKISLKTFPLEDKWVIPIGFEFEASINSMIQSEIDREIIRALEERYKQIQIEEIAGDLINIIMILVRHLESCRGGDWPTYLGKYNASLDEMFKAAMLYAEALYDQDPEHDYSDEDEDEDDSFIPFSESMDTADKFENGFIISFRCEEAFHTLEGLVEGTKWPDDSGDYTAGNDEYGFGKVEAGYNTHEGELDDELTEVRVSDLGGDLKDIMKL